MNTQQHKSIRTKHTFIVKDFELTATKHLCM